MAFVSMFAKPLGLAISTLTALLAAYTISICIYRIFFHPLANYPGPWLAKVTSCYSVYHAWVGDIHIDMWRCHEKYGQVVRYAPNRIIFNSAKAVQDIYNHKSNVVKSQAYEALVHRAPNILTLRDKEKHGRRRRVVSQALSDSSIASFEGDIQHLMAKFVGILGSLCPSQSGPGSWSVPTNVAKICDYLAFDLMAKIVFSAEYDMLGTTVHRPVLDAILHSNVRMGVLFQEPAIAKWKIHKRLFPVAIAGRGVFVCFVTRMVTDRIELGKNQGIDRPKPVVPDVFGRLAMLKDPETGSNLSMAELGAESTTLIVAGSDTTSAALAATLFYLAQDTTAQRRAQEEVDTTFGSSGDIRLGLNLSSCTFLSACINEALRLSPPVGSALWRVTSDGGTIIDGNYVPTGCDVGVGVYSIQRSGVIYDGPNDFVPQRWLVEGEEERQKLYSAWSPFSRGPRSCVGKSLAMVELMLAMAWLCKELEWRFEEGNEAERTFHLKEHIVGQKNGPVLEFRKRIYTCISGDKHD